MTSKSQDTDKRVNEHVESALRDYASGIAESLTHLGIPRHEALEGIDDAAEALARAQENGATVLNPRAFMFKVAYFSALNRLRLLRRKSEMGAALLK